MDVTDRNALGCCDMWDANGFCRVMLELRAEGWEELSDKGGNRSIFPAGAQIQR